MQVINLDRSTHETAQKLLPWFVAGTLQDVEHALVQEHARTCSQCQADIDWERKFRGLIGQEQDKVKSSTEIERSRQRLQSHLETHGFNAIVRKLKYALYDAWHYSSSAMRMLVAAESIAIVGLVYLLWTPMHHATSPAIIHTGIPAANLLVAFKPNTTEVKMREILFNNSARLVDGPTASGAYLLSTPGNLRAQTLLHLRAENAVSTATALDQPEMQ